MSYFSDPSGKLPSAIQDVDNAGRVLEFRDILQLPRSMESAPCAEGLDAAWQEEVIRVAANNAQSPKKDDFQHPSLTWVIYRVYWKQFWIAFLFRFIHDTLNVSMPLLLQQFIRWIKSADAAENLWVGYVYAISIGILAGFNTISLALTFDSANGLFQQVRSALMSMTFTKSMRLSATVADSNAGRITALHGNDVSKLKEMQHVFATFTFPFAFIGVIVVLWYIVGWPGLLSLLILMVLPIQARLTHFMSAAKAQFSIERDVRLQRLSELLNGIRICKFMGWEECFAGVLEAQRGRELQSQISVFAYRSALVAISHSLPMLLMVLILGTMWGIEGHLDADRVFPCIAIITTLRSFCTGVALSAGKLSEAFVIFSRFGEFLRMDERVAYVEHRGDGDNGPFGEGSVEATNQAAVSIPQAVTFGFLTSSSLVESCVVVGEDSKPPTATSGPTIEFAPLLSSLQLTIPKGKLTMIVGATGSGKSSLITALLGESIIEPQDAEDKGPPLVMPVIHFGNIAYVPQDAWIMNATIRDNVALTTPTQTTEDTELQGNEPASEEENLGSAAVVVDALDVDRYVNALVACQLYDDLTQQFTQSLDLTEIGERGINLSGGQKQRVALARAVYHSSTRDIVLLDDPLSAVDPHVCEAIFSQCIRSLSFVGAEGGSSIVDDDDAALLEGKTRILVTHHVQFLPRADFIVCMEDCQIAFRGTPEEYLEWRRNRKMYDPEDDDEKTKEQPSLSVDESPSFVASPVTTRSEHKKRQRMRREKLKAMLFESVQTVAPPDAVTEEVGSKRSEEEAEKGKLMTKEDAKVGEVEFGVYLWYFRCAGKGVIICTFLSFVLWRGGAQLAEIWLSYWTSEAPAFGRDHFAQWEYMMLFCIFACVSVMFTVLRQLMFVKSVTNISKEAHGSLVQRILHAPTSFFDSTPLGRIMHRFGKDIETIDMSIPEELNFVLNLIMIVISQVVVMCMTAVYIIPLVVIVSVLYLRVNNLFATSLRCLRRLENLARSPVITLLGQSIAGLQSLRAYGAIDVFESRHSHAVNLLLRAEYSFRCVQLWALIWIGCLGGMISLGLNILAVVMRTETASAAVYPGGDMIGLGVTYGVITAYLLTYLVAMSSHVRSQMSAVERVKEYCEDMVPQEEVVIYDETSSSCGDGVVGASASGHHNADVAAEEPRHVPPPPMDWPSDGSIRFEHVSLRYRPDLPLVLNDVSFAVKSGERIGVVGRTGSGKSTLMLALFRMVEHTAAQQGCCEEGGAIYLSNWNTRNLNMPELRRQITIIPQDPLLFAGTIRSNIDPFQQHTDDVLWEAIDRVRLRWRLSGAHSPHSHQESPSSRSDGKGPGDDEPLAAVRSKTATGLETEVAEKGSNFSVGQRQLLCLARALLKKSKVLLLDEATASVDFEADTLIQRTIRTEFTNCTVLTIAHRLATVIDSDKILVLSQGEVVEYGSPHELLQRGRLQHEQQMTNPFPIAASAEDNQSTTPKNVSFAAGSTTLYSMVMQLGEEEYERLASIAAEKHAASSQ